MSRRRRTAAALAVVTTVTTAGFTLTLLPGAGPVAAAAALTPYNDCKDLVQAYRTRLVEAATAYPAPGPMFAEDRVSLASSATAKAVGTSSTGTNVQEAGVDEPDSVKLAGDVLLVVAGHTVQILQPGPTPRLLSVVSLGQDSYGAQLLVDGTRVLALTQASSRMLPLARPYGFRPQAGRTVATLIDISDTASPKVLETTTTDGDLVSARLTDGRVRIVTSSAPRVDGADYPRDSSPAAQRHALLVNRLAASQVGLEEILPQTERRDGAGALLSRGPAVACADVSHPRSGPGTSTLTVTSLDLARTLAPTGSVALNADGNLAYMSAKTLYVATSRWGVTVAGQQTGRPEEVTTQLHSFDLAGPTVAYRGSGTVPGYLLNSYSMSEYDGHLRVATTRQPPWQPTARGVAAKTSASVVILKRSASGALVQTGRVDGLGKGEQIYAVRFLDDIATVVTFRQTDPLYTLDLADPAVPKVLGQLKIPGFSNYLHPIGDGTLVGIGQDTDQNGRVTGLQLATFDLTDLAAPRRSRTLSLGLGYSDASQDPHAFSYSPGLRTLTIPMSDDRGQSFLLGVRAGARELVEVGRLAAPDGARYTRSVLAGGQVIAVSDTGIVAADPRDLSLSGSVRFRL